MSLLADSRIMLVLSRIRYKNHEEDTSYMLRKFTSLLVITLLICSNMSLVFANVSSELAVIDKVVVVEKFFTGTEQTGALVERINKLEKDLWGKESTGALVNRVDKMYAYCKITTNNEPSFLIKMNAAEWSLTHMVTVQPIKTRIENLERVLMGNTASGSFDERLNHLLKLAYTSGKPGITSVTVEKDNLLKVKLVTPLNTRTTRSGDVVVFQVSEDIYVDGSLIIAKGAQGTGKIAKVEEAKNFGRDAQIQINFDTVEAIDGSIINTFLGEKAKQENKSLATAAGASVAGMIILGPVGIVGGAFVHGKEVNIPAGTETYIQVKEQVTLSGI